VIFCSIYKHLIFYGLHTQGDEVCKFRNIKVLLEVNIFYKLA